MSKRQATLFGFGISSKKTKVVGDASTSEISKEPDPTGPEISEKTDKSDVSENINTKDIGNVSYQQAPTLDDAVKYELLTSIWIPEADFKFPATGSRNLRFQYSWLQTYKWLSYSEHLDGAFCKFCVFFSKHLIGKGSSVKVGQLVAQPFNNYKKAHEVFRGHSENIYHKNCVIDFDNFLKIYENKKKNIFEELDSARVKEMEDNKIKIKPIIETIIFCGRQGLALRGHRDSGPLQFDTEPKQNDGNFRALLRFKVNSGDEVLRNHLEKSSLKAKYTSPLIQNEIIKIIGSLITKQLVEEVNAACGFSVLADETTDVSHKEQMTLCIRYCN